jgi:hypothetical protein
MSHRTLCNIVIFALAFAVGYRIEGNLTRAAASSTRTGVPVEVFASKGCSSWPSAEQKSMDLADVIAMSRHVDYWNGPGWSDPLPDPQFAARQNQYAKAFKSADVYTPQMVIDVQAEFVLLPHRYRSAGRDLALGRGVRSCEGISFPVRTKTC